MADLSIWIHGPEFGSSVIQVPIIKEVWKKRPKLIIDFNLIEKNKPIIEYYFSDKIKKRLAAVETIKLIHELVYKESMDLSTVKTLAAVTKNSIINSLPLYLKFKKRVYNKKIKLLISAGLAEIGILPKLIKKSKPKSLYLFNYLLEHCNFFSLNFVNNLTRKLFLKHYNNFDKTVIQTFFPDREYKIKKEMKNIELINIIARDLTKSKGNIRKELGIKRNEKLIFLALGGAKFFERLVESAENISKEHSEIKFLLLPRTEEEVNSFKNRQIFITPNQINFDTQDYVGASDIVVTKCGFGIIPEAIKHKTNILSVHLPTHAEVTETEIILQKEGVIKNTIDLKNRKGINKSSCIFKHLRQLIAFLWLKICNDNF